MIITYKEMNDPNQIPLWVKDLNHDGMKPGETSNIYIDKDEYERLLEIYNSMKGIKVKFRKEQTEILDILKNYPNKIHYNLYIVIKTILQEGNYTTLTTIEEDVQTLSEKYGIFLMKEPKPEEVTPEVLEETATTEELEETRVSEDDIFEVDLELEEIPTKTDNVMDVEEINMTPYPNKPSIPELNDLEDLSKGLELISMEEEEEIISNENSIFGGTAKPINDRPATTDQGIHINPELKDKYSTTNQANPTTNQVNPTTVGEGVTLTVQGHTLTVPINVIQDIAQINLGEFLSFCISNNDILESYKKYKQQVF